MILAIGIDRLFDFLPTFHLGKLWSFFKVKQPTNLTPEQERAQERAMRFHYVTWDGTDPRLPDDLIGGHVYVSVEGRTILWEESDDKYGFEARYLKKTPEELFPSKRNSRAVALDDTRDVGDKISAEDREAMLRDYYGEDRIAGILDSVRKLSGPFRPLPVEWRNKPIAWLVQDDKYIPSHEGWAGIVLSSKAGDKLIFASLGWDGRIRFGDSYYIALDPMDYVETAKRQKPSSEKTPNFVGFFSEIERRRGAALSPEDRAWAERCLKNENGAFVPVKEYKLG